LFKSTFSNRSIDISINVLAPVWDWSIASTTFKIASLNCWLSAIKWARAILEHHDATISLLKKPMINKWPNVYWLEAIIQIKFNEKLFLKRTNYFPIAVKVFV